MLGLAVDFSCLAAMVVGVAMIGRSRSLAAACTDVRPGPEPAEPAKAA